MSVHVRAPAERLPTHTTVVRLFPGVGADVQLQVLPALEALLAELTLEGPLLIPPGVWGQGEGSVGEHETPARLQFDEGVLAGRRAGAGRDAGGAGGGGAHRNTRGRRKATDGGCGSRRGGHGQRSGGREW